MTGPSPRSIRVRLTAWYASAMAVGLLLFAFVSFTIVRHEIQERTDRLLDEAARAFSAELQLEYRMLGTRAAAIRETLEGVRFRGIALGVLDSASAGGIALLADSSGGAQAGGGPNIGAEPLPSALAARAALLRSLPQLRQRAATGSGFVQLTVRGSPDVRARVLVDSLGALPDESLGEPNEGAPRERHPAVVVAARDLRDDAAALRGAAMRFALLVMAALLVAVVGGYALTRRTLAPIAAISRQAQQMGAADLSARLPVATPHDELGALAGTINDLLERIERSVAQQRQFVADASHELRTPVAIIRNEARVTLGRDERTDGDYRDALGAVLRESERLTRLVEDLFLLARADAGGQALRPEPLYLEDLLRDVVRATRTLAEQRQVVVSLDATEDGEWRGDPAMLRRLLLNLVDNAIKYSPPGSEVRLSLARATGAWELQVRDQGPGIPPVERERIFERFVRGDAARTRVRDTATSGAGLGLAIARYIAVAHGGSLDLVDAEAPGATFRLRLPI